MNAKDEMLNLPGFTKPLPFNEEALTSIDKEIRDVFEDSKLITPDYVRGNFDTLEKAILASGWPTIENSRGKFIFVLDELGEKQKTYIKNHWLNTKSCGVIEND